MSTTPDMRVVELFVKMALLIVVYGLLIFLLCGCGEQPFRCSKCKSHTQVILVPRFNGKTTTHLPQYRTTWECKDPYVHSKEEYNKNVSKEYRKD